MLLSVSVRLRVPPDLAHSMTKERPARKGSECTFPIAKHNYNAESFKIVIKLFVLTTLNVFKTSSQKSGETSLLINESSTSDPSSVLPVWADHFSNLGTSHLSTNPSLQEISNTIPEVEIAALVEEESILDVSFLPEEVDAALNRLNRSSSAGPDSLPTEPHLCWPASQVLVRQSFRCYCEFRSKFPLSSKRASSFPFTRARGRTPSYLEATEA